VLLLLFHFFSTTLYHKVWYVTMKNCTVVSLYSLLILMGYLEEQKVVAELAKENKENKERYSV
jgi:hypothetical protein